MIRKLTFLMLTVLLSSGMAHAGVANGTANLVLGQQDFTQNAAGTTGGNGFNQPHSVAVDKDSGRVFVADTLNNRVLWWEEESELTNGSAPDGVIGQPDFVSVLANQDGNVHANTLNNPHGIWVDRLGNLWVADFYNSRVLRYGWPFSNNMSANLVLGQSDFDSGGANRGGAVAANSLRHPIGVTVDPSGTVWVADYDNHRVLRYSGSVTIGRAADLVLGQRNFTVGVVNDSNGDGETDDVTARGLNFPEAVFVDASGNLWVADHMNHRFLRFTGPFTDGMNANLVLGQPDFALNIDACTGPVNASNVRCAFSLSVDPWGNIWGVDSTNNRIMRFNEPLSNGMASSQIIGQAASNTAAINRGGLPGAETLFNPNFVFADADGNLWVSEHGNNRVLKFNSSRASALTPSQWNNAMAKDFTINGEGIVPGSAFRLQRTGQNDIVGTNVSLSGETFATCTFDLTGAAEGAWDLVIDYQGYQTILDNALTVVPVGLSAIVPEQALNNQPVRVTLTGQNFYPGTTPRLIRSGTADIVATEVAVNSVTELACTFDISGAPAGFWNVVVPPANDAATIVNGFQVQTISVASIEPVRGVNTGPVDVTITGTNFLDGCFSSLEQAGCQPISSSDHALIGASTMTCSFNLAEATTGYYAVCVTSGASVGRLADGFSIHYPSAVVRFIDRTMSHVIGIENDQGQVIVRVPAFAFAEDLWMTVAVPRTLEPLVDQPELIPSDVSVEITTDKGLHPERPMNIDYFYNPAYVAGLDRSKLISTYYDQASAKWLHCSCTCDAAGNCVRSTVRHLSCFRIVQRVPAATLSAVSTYPNPYRPGSNGVFDNSLSGDGVVFTGLTENAELRIFTLAGDLVREVNIANGNGTFLWDTLNGDGERVASGVYLYYISNPADGSQTNKGRLAIIR